MEGFAAKVKQGDYKKIDYLIWRELKELPDEWNLNIQMHTGYSLSETDPSFSTISWNGCNCPYRFPVNDGSLGEYIRRRKMTKAAFELQRSNIKILELAMVQHRSR